MEKLFKLSKVKIRTDLLYNKSNDYTSLYYLMLNKKIKSGRKSIADLKSELFISYIENKKIFYQITIMTLRMLLKKEKWELYLKREIYKMIMRKVCLIVK